MNFFTNSILNIILTMFNSVFSDQVLLTLSVFILFENLCGMYYTYKICKGKTRYPILYVLPIVREIAVLVNAKKNNYKVMRNVGCFLLALSGSLYIICLSLNIYPKEVAYICVISLAIVTILFAILNANFIFGLHNETKTYYGALGILSLYLAPLFTLIFLDNEIEEEKKRKKSSKGNKPYKTISKALALVILINTFYGSVTTCYASEIPNHVVNDNRIMTGCEICDSASEKILLPLEIKLDSEDDYLKCYAVTCKDCEIFHVFENEDLNLPDADDLGYNYNRYCAYFDFSNTSLKTGDNYNGLPFNYYQEKHFAVINFVFSNGKLAHNEEYYYNGIRYGYYYDANTKEYYDDESPNSKYFFSDELLYRCIISTAFNGAAEFDEKTSDAVKCYPKNSNFKPDMIYQYDNCEENELSDNPTYSEKNVDNKNVNDYTSNNKTYDNKFNTNTFIKKSVEKSLTAVAVTGTLTLLTAVTSPAWGTVLATTACISGAALTTFWLCERGYEFVKLFTGDYNCKEEQEAATYRFLEETTSDLVGLGTGYACSRVFGNLVNKYKNVKTTQDLIDYENAKLPKLYKSTDYNEYKDWYDLADYIKSHNMTLPDNYKTKIDIEKLGWRKGANPSDFGYSIGGDIYQNQTNELPNVDGRIYYEADVGYVSGPRTTGKGRLVWSNDGDFYYTIHYDDGFSKLEW